MIIMSEEGAQQGDPLGSLLFCLAIQSIVVKLLSEFNVWYIDNGAMGGIPSHILHDIRIIKAEWEMIGLTFNESRCELIKWTTRSELPEVSWSRCHRHTAINSTVMAAQSSAEIPSCLESRWLARDDGKRPDGVTSMPWKNSRCLISDVTCPDTLAASYLDKAVTGPGVVATEAETRKRQ